MGDRVDSATRLIQADASRVYRAFADPGALEAWLPPKGMRGEMIAFSFHEGGGYRMRLTYQEPRHAHGKTTEDSDEVDVRFLRLIPDQQIEQVVEFDSERAEYAGSMNMTWLLVAMGKRTRVTVRCTHVPPGIAQDDHEAGLSSTLDKLAEFMKRTGPDQGKQGQGGGGAQGARSVPGTGRRR